jgi:hypothetical protein
LEATNPTAMLTSNNKHAICIMSPAANPPTPFGIDVLTYINQAAIPDLINATPVTTQSAIDVICLKIFISFSFGAFAPIYLFICVLRTLRNRKL